VSLTGKRDRGLTPGVTPFTRGDRIDKMAGGFKKTLETSEENSEKLQALLKKMLQKMETEAD